MAEARIHPPSEQRIAEARRAGHVPRTTLLPVAVWLACLALGAEFLGDALVGQAGAFWRHSLQAAARGQPPELAVWLAQLRSLLGPVGLFLAASWGLCVLVSFWVQGSALKLPFARSRKTFEPLRPPRTARLLVGLGCLLLVFASLFELALARPDSASELLVRWLTRAALLFGLCALIEAALARAAFFRSLWLTRREQREEQREAYGSPELRAERERLRRAQRAVERP